MALNTKTSEIILSMDGHNCSIQKRLSDIDLYAKTKDVKNLLNFFLSVYLFKYSQLGPALNVVRWQRRKD